MKKMWRIITVSFALYHLQYLPSTIFPLWAVFPPSELSALFQLTEFLYWGILTSSGVIHLNPLCSTAWRKQQLFWQDKTSIRHNYLAHGYSMAAQRNLKDKAERIRSDIWINGWVEGRRQWLMIHYGKVRETASVTEKKKSLYLLTTSSRKGFSPTNTHRVFVIYSWVLIYVLNIQYSTYTVPAACYNFPINVKWTTLHLCK